MPNYRRKVMTMARKKTIEELQSEQEKLEQELKVKQQNLKALRRQKAELTRKERTHRLCTHGAMLEQYLAPERFTDEQVSEMLKVIFNWDPVIQLMKDADQYNNKTQTN